MIRKVVLLFFLFGAIVFVSCEKKYDCVCANIKSGEAIYVESVKTTNLGKKGFEKSCKSHDGEGDYDNCHLE